MTNFVGPSYHLNVRKADVQRVVNMFPVVNEVAGSKSVAYLESTPGLVGFSTDTGGFLLLEDGGHLLNEDGSRIRLE
jgi:hypothetical protein